MENYNVNDVCVFDTETTGLPPKKAKWDEDFDKFPHIVQLAWSFGDKERSEIIYPDGYEIPEETAKIHGITTQIAIDKGKPFVDVVEEFIDDASTAPLICAHNIYFDTSIIKANILRYLGRDYYEVIVDSALDKCKRIDTMYKTAKFVNAHTESGRFKFPRLEELYARLFNNETFPAHNALEDVRALKKCVCSLVELGLIELKQKEY